MAIDLAAIEAKVKTVAGDVYSELERDAHTKVGQILLDTAKDLLPFVPGGALAEQIVGQFEALAQTAHQAIHDAAGANDPLKAIGEVASGAEQVAADVKADTSALTPPETDAATDTPGA
jgi:hypothetical protein